MKFEFYENIKIFPGENKRWIKILKNFQKFYKRFLTVFRRIEMKFGWEKKKYFAAVRRDLFRQRDRKNYLEITCKKIRIGAKESVHLKPEITLYYITVSDY